MGDLGTRNLRAPKVAIRQETTVASLAGNIDELLGGALGTYAGVPSLAALTPEYEAIESDKISDDMDEGPGVQRLAILQILGEVRAGIAEIPEAERENPVTATLHGLTSELNRYLNKLSLN